MKVKVSELVGVQLDLAVALAIGGKITRPQDAQICLNGEHMLCGEKNKRHSRYVYSPSTNWEQCGSLIEFFRAGLDWNTCNIDEDYDDEPWFACVSKTDVTQYGPTPLIAICRAVVESKYGDEVELPDDLV